MTDDPDVEARRRYDAFHRRSLEDPDAFWREAAQLIDVATREPPERRRLGLLEHPIGWCGPVTPVARSCATLSTCNRTPLT